MVDHLLGEMPEQNVRCRSLLFGHNGNQVGIYLAGVFDGGIGNVVGLKALNMVVYSFVGNILLNLTGIVINLALNGFY